MTPSYMHRLPRPSIGNALYLERSPSRKKMTPSYMHHLPRPSIGNVIVPVTLFRRKKMMMISTQHPPPMATKTETMARIQRDPELFQIISDPVMQNTQQQAKQNPELGTQIGN
jgi:hypothetical protein